MPLFVILKQIFFIFINKAMDHFSSTISCVADVYVRNLLSSCNTNYR